MYIHAYTYACIYMYMPRGLAETTQNKTKQTCFTPGARGGLARTIASRNKRNRNKTTFVSRQGGGLEIRGTIECRNKNKFKQNN